MVSVLLMKLKMVSAWSPVYGIGTLNVIVHGDFLPRTFLNKFYILFAIIRALYLAFVVTLRYPHFDVIFCDQNAAYILILSLFCRSKILFYCHHPDFVQTPHDSLLKRMYWYLHSFHSSYRVPFDLFEEYCVSMADRVLVNSKYTQSVYCDSYRVLSHFSSTKPTILYPCVDFDAIRKLASFVFLVLLTLVWTRRFLRSLTVVVTSSLSIDMSERRRSRKQFLVFPIYVISWVLLPLRRPRFGSWSLVATILVF